MNQKRLLCSQKAGVKCSYYKLSGIQNTNIILHIHWKYLIHIAFVLYLTLSTCLSYFNAYILEAPNKVFLHTSDSDQSNNIEMKTCSIIQF